MSRAQLRELTLLFVICSALTVAVFFLALWLLPFETFARFPVLRFPGVPWFNFSVRPESLHITCRSRPTSWFISVWPCFSVVVLLLALRFMRW